jgi:hypothetical protein
MSEVYLRDIRELLLGSSCTTMPNNLVSQIIPDHPRILPSAAGICAIVIRQCSEIHPSAGFFLFGLGGGGMQRIP